MLYSVLQPPSCEDSMACVLTMSASRGVQDSISERVVRRNCARIVKILFGFSSLIIIIARQRRQVDLSPSGAKFPNKYRSVSTTSRAVMTSTRGILFLPSPMEPCL
jgi:hypothetical protein